MSNNSGDNTRETDFWCCNAMAVGNINVVCIAETWLKDHVKETAFNNEIGKCDYSIFRHDRLICVASVRGFCLQILCALFCELCSLTVILRESHACQQCFPIMI